MPHPLIGARVRAKIAYLLPNHPQDGRWTDDLEGVIDSLDAKEGYWPDDGYEAKVCIKTAEGRYAYADAADVSLL